MARTDPHKEGHLGEPREGLTIKLIKTALVICVNIIMYNTNIFSFNKIVTILTYHIFI